MNPNIQYWLVIRQERATYIGPYTELEDARAANQAMGCIGTVLIKKPGDITKFKVSCLYGPSYPYTREE